MAYGFGARSAPYGLSCSLILARASSFATCLFFPYCLIPFCKSTRFGKHFLATIIDRLRSRECWCFILSRALKKQITANAVRRGQLLAFALALSILAIALVSPLATWAHHLFAAHMTQHMLLILLLGFCWPTVRLVGLRCGCCRFATVSAAEACGVGSEMFFALCQNRSFLGSCLLQSFGYGAYRVFMCGRWRILLLTPSSTSPCLLLPRSFGGQSCNPLVGGGNFKLE